MMADRREPTVLAGIADRTSGGSVLAQALDLAARLQGTLIVTHVTEPLPAGAALPAAGMAGPAVLPLDPEQARLTEQARLDEEEAWIRSLHDEVAVEPELAAVPWTYQAASGDPGHTLVDLAAQLGAYCVVVGSRGEGVRAMLSRLVRPSVSHAVISERQVPVLVVPLDPPASDVADGA